MHTHALTHTHTLTRQWSLSRGYVHGVPPTADTVNAFDTLAPEILGKIPWESLPPLAWPLPELLFCSVKNSGLSQFPE